MTICSSKFTPEALLRFPRRSAGVPNSDASVVLYSRSVYSFDKHKKSSEILFLDVKTQQSTHIDISGKCSNPAWLNDSTIALLRSTDEQRTELLIGSPYDFKDTYYIAATINAPADNFKITKLGHERYGVALSAASNPDGSLYSPGEAKKSQSTGRLYSSLFVRHWDTWITPQRNTIWYGALYPQDNSREMTKVPRYTLSPLVNALRVTAIESPIPPFGGGDNFDVSTSGLILVAKDPSLDPAINTKCRLYLVPLTSFQEKEPVILEIQPPSIMQGAMTSPTFSKDGSKAAFLMMRENGYESDKNELFLMPDVTKPAGLVHLLNRDDPKLQWDRSPISVEWSLDKSLLFLIAEDQGRKQIFSVSTNPKRQPTPQLHSELFGSVDNVQSLQASSASHHELFVSSTSIVDNSVYSILTVESGQSHHELAISRQRKISSNTRNGSLVALREEQLSEILSPRASKSTKGPQAVHSLLVKPTNFDSKKKYPLAFLIHGGPQGAWMNAWSTRWHPAVFAEQGYVVVCPNPTGSTGYGQDFTDAIKGQWGGLPYEDLVNCFEYIKKHLDFIDTSRAVALGASYGGYMVNWIQGHPLGRKFKALVTHDGVYSTSFALATEELYFPLHEFGEFKSSNRKGYTKWSPEEHADNWKTPHLIIHNEKDFRLTISDGLAPFNVLQMKGIDSQLLTFPDENHFVLNPENSLVWHETVFNFINRHVGLPLYSEGDPHGIVQDPARPQAISAEAGGRLLVAR